MNEQVVNAQEFLLCDEKDLPMEEYNRRVRFSQLLIENVPHEVFENLSVFQPSVGCLNLCSFCSQESGPLIRFLDGSSIRTLAGGIRGAIHQLNIPFVSCNREYKHGVIFPYLDNDIGSYPYLLDYLIAMASLGLKTRISTVGWSRHNYKLKQMHNEIVNNYQYTLSGIRFSLTPYTVGFKTNPDEFIIDFTSSLSIYLPLLGRKDSSGACIDICCKPDIITGSVIVQHAGGCMTVRCGEYLLIVRMDNLRSPATAIQIIGTLNESDNPFIEQMIRTWKISEIKESIVVEVGSFLPFINEDGPYYAFIPSVASDNTDGVFYYLQTKKRDSGVMDARWPLRVLQSDEIIQPDSFTDYVRIEQICELHVLNTKRYSTRRAEYLSKQLLPLVKKLCKIFSLMGVEPKRIFNKDFIRDRGIIRNSGRAYSEFRKIASSPNIMVVPDPVLSIKNNNEVWRMFPTPSVSNVNAHNWYGRKSEPYTNGMSDATTNVILAILAVDPSSHSNIDKDKKQRRAIYIPIGEFVQPLYTITFAQGKKWNYIPGIAPQQEETM
jgi:hypothetical protein